MAYTQSLIDNFDDNVIDTGKWTIAIASGLTEVGQKLRFSANSSYPTIHGRASFDITKGILAAKMIATGSGGAETEFEFGVRDGSGNAVKLFGTPVNGDINFSISGAATQSGMVVTDVAGVGGGWTSNSWIGIGNLGSDNVIHVYKSSDGITWTEMARTTVAGTFNKKAVGLFISIGKWGGTTSWVFEFDDASFWYTLQPNQTLIDNFDDNSINPAKWTTPLGIGGISEANHKLNIADTTNYPTLNGESFFDLTSGILAARLEQSGTATSETRFYFGAHDATPGGVGFELAATPFNAGFSVAEVGLTIVEVVVLDATVGIGPSWIDYTWLGVGNIEPSGTDRIAHFYTSTDAITWTEIAYCTIFGTASFDETAAKIVLGTGTTGSAASTWTAHFEDASYFSIASEPTTDVKVRVGGAWVTGKSKVRVGGAWVTGKSKVRVGGAWITT